jgi:uncharacterized membrane protein
MVIGVAVDVGHAFIVRRDLVAAADDAALAGSQVIDVESLHQGSLQLDPPAAQEAALATLSGEQGIQAQASAGAIVVHVERQFPTILLRMVGVTTLTVTAEATAAPQEP